MEKRKNISFKLHPRHGTPRAKRQSRKLYLHGKKVNGMKGLKGRHAVKKPLRGRRKKATHPLNAFPHIFSSSRIQAQSKYHAGRSKSRHNSTKVQDICSGLRGGNQDTREDDHSQVKSSQVQSARVCPTGAHLSLLW